MRKEEEETPYIRSIRADRRSYVTFINKTSCHVDLYWINYSGIAVLYTCLAPDGSIDINTYVTHPWIFVRKFSQERYVANQKDVYYPQPSYVEDNGALLSTLPSHLYSRHKVYITIPVYTLRQMCLMAIRQRLSYYGEAFLLEIPRSLQQELARMLPKEWDSNE